jgi:hypothetical protein
MDRLTERLDDGRAITPFCTRYDDNNHNECYVGHSVDRLADYEDTNLTPAECAEYAQAKRDGRLVVLPVSIGDTVYRVCYVCRDGRWLGYRHGYEIIRRLEVAPEKFTLSNLVNIGKTVFLSREEAEKALKKESKSDG